MSVLNVSLEIEMWKFQNSTMTNCNTAHAMGLLYLFLYRGEGVDIPFGVGYC